MEPQRRRLRVDQLLSRYGYCSRREAVDWIRAGRVRQHAIALVDPAERVDPHEVRVDGEVIEAPDGLLLMFHKPLGVVCSRADQEGPSVYDLLPARWSRRNPPITTIGRLDRDTSGLLLVTDLGALVQRWTSPRHLVEKSYEVTVEGRLFPELIARFASGTLSLAGEDRPCRPARLEMLSAHEARVHLQEGRFHQVRRMFAAFGLRVIHLHRSRFGDYALGDLPAGAWRMMDLPTCSGP
jgi:16S rRNA pseudouridine516 synthase